MPSGAAIKLSPEFCLRNHGSTFTDSFLLKHRRQRQNDCRPQRDRYSRIRCSFSRETHLTCSPYSTAHCILSLDVVVIMNIVRDVRRTRSRSFALKLIARFYQSGKLTSGRTKLRSDTFGSFFSLS